MFMNTVLRVPRLYVNERLSEGRSLEPTTKTSHYLINVRRLRDGDRVLLFNGQQGEWTAILTKTIKSGIQLQCQHQTKSQQKSSSLALLFACIKRERQDYMIEKATELGASDFYPVITEHGQIRQFNAARSQLIAIEAAEQSERLDIPSFHPIAPLSDALTKAIEQQYVILACVERHDGAAPLTIMQSLTTEKLAVVIGPEGGWSATEQAFLHAIKQVYPVSLGRNILRAETAALTALSCWSCFRNL